MIDTASPRPLERPPPADALLRQALLPRAAALARLGELQGAVDLLDAAGPTARDDAACLDLLARIRAQQGAWLEAESLWQKVLRLQPGHAGAQAALVRLRSPRAQRWWALPLALGAAAAALAGALVLSHLAGARRDAEFAAVLKAELDSRAQAETARLDQQQAALNAKLSGLAEGQKNLTDRLAQTDGRVTSTLQSLAAARTPTPPLGLAFKVAGTRTELRDQALWVSFEPGLFAADGQLTPEGRRRLKAVARAIVQSQERVRLDVVASGEAQRLPGLTLAQRAAAVLQRSGLFPRGAVSSSVARTGASPSATPGAPPAAVMLKVWRTPPARAAATN